MPAAPRMREAAVDGGRLTVGVWGPEDPEAPTLLAVHGVTAHHRSFGLLAEALPDWRVIAPDLRGRGGSRELGAPFGMARHADDLAAVLDQLGVEGGAVVAGHSMGAFASLVLADRHPEKVSGLVLIDGGVPLRVPADMPADMVIRAVLGPAAERLKATFPDLDAYRAFWQQHPAFLEGWSELMEDYISYDLVGEAPALHASATVEALTEDTGDLVGGQDVLGALDRLAVDAELLWAPRGLMDEEPGLYTEEHLAEWAEKVPALGERLRTTFVPDANHYDVVMGEAGAAAVAEAVRRA